jgi:hypothetical protein
VSENPVIDGRNQLPKNETGEDDIAAILEYVRLLEW